MADGNQTQEKTFTQADIDSLNAKHQEEMNALAGKMRAEFKEKEQKAKAEAEKLAKQANMSELEKANESIKDLTAKLQASEDTIALTNQKDEARAYLKEIGVDISNLDYVFIPKDMDGTKARANAFKEMIDGVKKSTFENNVKSVIPKTDVTKTTTAFDNPTKKHSFQNFR